MVEPALIDVTCHDPLRAAELLEGVTRFVAERGCRWRVVLRQLGGAEVGEQIARSGGAGVLCHVTAPAGVWERVAGLGRPVVGLYPAGVGLAASVRERCGFVDHDHVAIGRMGARHLLELGLPRVAFLGVDDGWSELRRAGFEAEVRAAGAEVLLEEAKVLRRAWDGGGAKRVRQWLAGLTRPVGVMACNDGVATWVLEACEGLGRAVGRGWGWGVPGEVAVVGVDNSVLHCEFAPTALTSVQPDTVRVGYEAAAMLEGLMRAGEGREVRVAPLGVVGRRSTARLLYGDEDVDRAMRFLRGHAARSISVQDIADELSVGRRSLERKFRRLTGGTPDEALRRVRLESAAAMLVKSDASMLEVASACGFSSQSYFSQAFRRAYGTNPGEYRERAKREGRR